MSKINVHFADGHHSDLITIGDNFMSNSGTKDHFVPDADVIYNALANSLPIGTLRALIRIIKEND